jgi:hypothetical protein
MCGLRTGYIQPLGLPLRQGVENGRSEVEIVTGAALDDDDDIALEPPVERAPGAQLSVEMLPDPEPEIQAAEEPAPVARRVSLGGLIVGTTLVAVCLGLGRVSLAAGIIAFLVLLPAHIRTLSAISYFRDHRRELARNDIAAIFAVSLVLSLMGLAAAGLVFLVTVFVSGFVVRFLPIVARERGLNGR